MNSLVRVVLARPTIAANIGAAARVMANFGLSDLRLVAPEADPFSEEARKLSARGEPILEGLKRHDDLAEALVDCVLTAGTSARTAGVFRSTSAGLVWEIMPRLIEAAASGPVALVFGSEPAGLTNEELVQCHYVMHIPTAEAYPALNLAQSVAICLYELQRAALTRTGSSAPRALAPHEAQARMFEHLRQALEEIHFLWGENAESLMHALRHLLGRAGLTPIEVDLLHGLARQIRWSARQAQTGERKGE
jgi:tRNA/rRNA methyltransferase